MLSFCLQYHELDKFPSIKPSSATVISQFNVRKRLPKPRLKSYRSYGRQKSLSYRHKMNQIIASNNTV